METYNFDEEVVKSIFVRRDRLISVSVKCEMLDFGAEGEM